MGTLVPVTVFPAVIRRVMASDLKIRIVKDNKHLVSTQATGVNAEPALEVTQ